MYAETREGSNPSGSDSNRFDSFVNLPQDMHIQVYVKAEADGTVSLCKTRPDADAVIQLKNTGVIHCKVLTGHLRQSLTCSSPFAMQAVLHEGLQTLPSNFAETATAAAKLHIVDRLSRSVRVMLVHHLEFGLWAILPSHGPRLPSWHGHGLSALLLGLVNGLLHKGGLSGLCPGVVKALLTLKVRKVGLGS